MKPETIKLIKEEMGYTEEATVQCKNCKYAKEVECRYVDRMWYWVCTHNPLGDIEINGHGRCKFYSEQA